MILHVDMDAFYASVEQLDNPELRGKPVIVGGSPTGRGVVSAASYEARKYGVRSAMPTAQAYKLCPHGHFVHTRMHRYTELSRQIRSIFERYTPEVEPLSIDEAFLDVHGCVHLFGGAEAIGLGIKQAIAEELELVASVGIAPNKFLAKLASDLDKPDGFTVIQADRVMEMLEPLSVSRLWGVGRATIKKFEKHSLHTFGDVQRLTVEQAVGLLGERMGKHFWRLARGLDSRAVQSTRRAKTVSNEQTFSKDISCPEELKKRLMQLTDKVAARLRRSETKGRTANLKVRFTGFDTITRAHTMPHPTNTTASIWAAAEKLLQPVLNENPGRSIRLLGIGVSNLEDSKPVQLELFPDDDTPNIPAESSKLDRATDAIRQQFGNSALQRGNAVKRSPRKP